jgi:hypothetical protein
MEHWERKLSIMVSAITVLVVEGSADDAELGVGGTFSQGHSSRPRVRLQPSTSANDSSLVQVSVRYNFLLIVWNFIIHYTNQVSTSTLFFLCFTILPLIMF